MINFILAYISFLFCLSFGSWFYQRHGISMKHIQFNSICALNLGDRDYLYLMYPTRGVFYFHLPKSEIFGNN
jgi:hypothetical protein